MEDLNTAQIAIVEEMLARRPDLESCRDDLLAFYQKLRSTYESGGKLLTCGNGGSHADSIHIVGELCKSFEQRRPLRPEMAERLKDLPRGQELSEHLEEGLAAITLGLNGALKTAVENDSSLRDIAFAQELYALGKQGDVVLAISTSGNAANCLMALSVARGIGATSVALTGPDGGEMARHADIAIRAPGTSVKLIQEAHITLYHTICLLIETHFFHEPRTSA